MNTRSKLLLALAIWGLTLGNAAADTKGEPRDTVVSTSQIPQHILNAAIAAVPNGQIVRVQKKLWNDDEFYYVFDVSRVRSFYTVTVGYDGTVAKVSEEAEGPVLSRD